MLDVIEPVEKAVKNIGLRKLTYNPWQLSFVSTFTIYYVNHLYVYSSFFIILI